MRHYANKNLCKFDVGQKRLKQFFTKKIEKNVFKKYAKWPILFWDRKYIDSGNKMMFY